jgi:uncharacterized protein
VDQDRLVIGVHVHPGARRRGVGGTHAGSLVVRVGARALAGAANSEVLSALAVAFGLSPSRVEFVRVTTSRDKLVALRGDVEALRERLVVLLSDDPTTRPSGGIPN